ncbi:MAG: hypothetical protein GVY02_04985 [Bacteroidetes bacterium]|jgi:hypothetical protein|nr:hypothetical protein [Bacteroidota bacterium]
MKRTIYFLITALLILIVTDENLRSQSHEGYYMQIEYIDIDDEMLPEFQNHIGATLKPLQESKIENDFVKEWYLYRVSYPSKPDLNYNFISIAISDDINKFAESSSSNSPTHAIAHHSGMPDALKQIMGSMHSELWSINNSVLTSMNAKPTRFLLMDYMDVAPGMDYTYQMMEDEIARPLHQQRMEDDTMEGWEVYDLIIPGGTEYGYNFATGNFFERLSDLEFGFTDEMIRQNHPDTDISEFNENINRTRDLVRSEVWELVDYAK